jgi:hypothetical protein
MCTYALWKQIQELAKQLTLNHGSGLQALREELVNEKQTLQEARQVHRPVVLLRHL